MSGEQNADAVYRNQQIAVRIRRLAEGRDSACSGVEITLGNSIVHFGWGGVLISRGG